MLRLRPVLIMIAVFYTHLSLSAQYDEWAEEYRHYQAEQCLTLKSEKDYLIGGIVSPLSGQVCARHTDMVVKGAHPVALHRCYVAPYVPRSMLAGSRRYQMHPASLPQADRKYDHERLSLFKHLEANYQGWEFLPQRCLTLEQGNVPLVTFTDANGMRMRLECHEDGTVTFPGKQEGLCNAVGDEPGGQYDPRNIRVTRKANDSHITVSTPDGQAYHYEKYEEEYLLKKERLANGKLLRYQYEKGALRRIESTDSNERYVYASIDVQGSPESGKCVFTGLPDQRTVYSYWTLAEPHKYLKKKRPFRKDRTKVSYDTTPPILGSVDSTLHPSVSMDYTDRFQLREIEGIRSPFVVDYLATSNRWDRSQLCVSSLQFPIDPKGYPNSRHQVILDSRA